MKSVRALYHLARADFLQRTRSYGFLITMGVMLYVAYVFVPPNHSSYATMTINEHRGVYNSAYLGCLMALLISPWLSLAGFYLVKNAIARDIQTGVGQILATTTLSKPLYTVGKAASNFAVLAVSHPPHPASRWTAARVRRPVGDVARIERRRATAHVHDRHDPANEAIAPLHARMPVALEPADWATWLDPDVDGDELLAMLEPRESDAIETFPVARLVNSVRNNGPALIEPVAAAE